MNDRERSGEWTVPGMIRATSAQVEESSSRQGLRWFLLFTKPASERIACCNLERQGYKVYYPRLLQPSLRNGRWIDRVVSLFPRYIFVQLDCAKQSLAPISSTLGVARIVRFGRELAKVPDQLVRSLMLAADPESGLHKLKGANTLKRGSRVTVIAGLFEGLEGVFERVDGQERVVILLKLLGQETAVRLPSGYVLPLGA